MTHEALCLACNKIQSFWERDSMLFCAACGMGKDAARDYVALRKAESMHLGRVESRAPSSPAPSSRGGVVLWIVLAAGLVLTAILVAANWDTPTLRHGRTGEQFMNRQLAKGLLVALFMGLGWGIAWLLKAIFRGYGARQDDPR